MGCAEGCWRRMGLLTKSVSVSNSLQKYMFLSSLLTMVPSCSVERGFEKGQQGQQSVSQEQMRWKREAGAVELVPFHSQVVWDV